MTSAPKVSIIIDNYNYARFLPDAIDSALNQTYENTEVIVVDDGSTDNSKEIIKSYEQKITAIVKENGGQASCFNDGFKMSTGDIIIFLDADDYLQHTAAEKAVALFNDPSVAKVHWRLRKVNHDKRITSVTLPDSHLAEGNLREQLIRNGPSNCGGPPNSPPTSGNAWSRSFLENVFPIPQDIFKGGADNYLFVLTPAYGSIRKIDEPLGFYRVHGTNNTVKSDYMESYFRRFEQCCISLSDHLAKQDINVDPSAWPRTHWYHKVHKAMEIVKEKVPQGSSFILADDQHWITETSFFGRHRIPFTEKNGEYAGPPPDDEAAIRELEKQREYATGFLVVPWSCYWYFNAYPKFNDYLNTNFKRIEDSDVVRIYDLRKRIGKSLWKIT